MRKSWLVAIFVLGGCGGGSPQPVEQVPLPKVRMVDVSGRVGTAPDRFKTESHGYFSGGYSNHSREIFIITDTQTGHQYLSITGCGVTELWTEKQGKQTVTVEE